MYYIHKDLDVYKLAPFRKIRAKYYFVTHSKTILALPVNLSSLKTLQYILHNIYIHFNVLVVILAKQNDSNIIYKILP